MSRWLPFLLLTSCTLNTKALGPGELPPGPSGPQGPEGTASGWSEIDGGIYTLEHNVGIGTATPTSQLHVESDDGAAIALRSTKATSGAYRILRNNAGTFEVLQDVAADGSGGTAGLALDPEGRLTLRGPDAPAALGSNAAAMAELSTASASGSARLSFGGSFVNNMFGIWAWKSSTSGSNAVLGLQPTGGSVRIGALTATPQEGTARETLEVFGSIRASGTSTGAGRIIMGSPSSNSQFEWYPGVGGTALVGLYYRDNATPAKSRPILFANSDGNMSIGTSGPVTAYALDIDGDLHASGSVTGGTGCVCSSSRAAKERVRPLDASDAQAAFARLEPVRFVYKRDRDEEKLGFIAEDVPDLVAQKDRKTLDPMEMTALLTKVVQEQQRRIDRLERALARRK